MVQLDPSREGAWRHLGYKKSGGRWVKPEEAAAAKLEAERQKHADKHWRSRLEKLREGLEGKDAAKRARAERALDRRDRPPRRADDLGRLHRRREPSDCRSPAVQMLGQIDGPAASAGAGHPGDPLPEGTVRAGAAETLMRRDPRDIVGRLISLIRKPFTYRSGRSTSRDRPASCSSRARPSTSAACTAHAASIPALIPGRASSRRRGASSPLVDAIADGLAGDAAPAAGPRRARASTRSTIWWRKRSPRPTSSGRTCGPRSRLDAIRQDIQVLAQRLAEDVQTIDAINAQIKQLNDRVLPIVTTMTGQDLGAEPEKWKAWWTDQLGYAFQKPADDQADVHRDRRLAELVGLAGMLRRGDAGPHDRRPAGDRVDPGRRPPADAEHVDRRAGLPARPGGPPHQVGGDGARSPRRRDARRHRHPPLLEGRQGLGHGPRPEAGRPRPRPRRASSR